jgi:hypothetical protein
VTTLSLILLFLRRHLTRFLRLPTCKRHFDHVVGFGSTVVPAHVPCTVSVPAQVAFRPERLVIPQDVARHFQVTDFQVNGRRQLSSVGAVPAGMFSDQSPAVFLEADVARPGELVSVTVVNRSDDDQVFQCGLCGPKV